MAQDLKPSTWIASWSENGTNVTFPIASVPELTAAVSLSYELYIGGQK